jgi:hypothetical protein
MCLGCFSIFESDSCYTNCIPLGLIQPSCYNMDTEMTSLLNFRSTSHFAIDDRSIGRSVSLSVSQLVSQVDRLVCQLVSQSVMASGPL